MRYVDTAEDRSRGNDGQGTGVAAAIEATSLPTENGCHAHELRLLYAAKLTVPQAAKMLGIGETRMRELIKNGDLPVIRIMGKILVLDRDLEAFLQSRYGSLTVAKRQDSRLPGLPKHILESGLLAKAS